VSTILATAWMKAASPSYDAMLAVPEWPRWFLCRGGVFDGWAA